MRRSIAVAGTATALTAVFASSAAAATGWRITATHANAALRAVATVSAKDAWAVGGETVSGKNRALVRHWNGKTWKKVAVPAALKGIYLDHVAASSGTNVWITGTDGRDKAYTLRWDGKKWHTGPTHTSFEPGGDAVAALGKKDVWLLGRGTNDLAAGHARHFDGKHWKTVSVPGSVSDVSAVSSRDIWAIGLVRGKNGYEAAVTHWNGKTWRRVSTGTEDVMYDSVRALGAKNVWVSGSMGGKVLHWNGKKWASLSPGHGVGLVGALASDGAKGLWAVADGTRLLRYHAGHWSVSALPQRAGHTTRIEALAQVKGTTSVWGVGVLTVAKGDDDVEQADVTVEYGR